MATKSTDVAFLSMNWQHCGTEFWLYMGSNCFEVF